VAVGIGKTDLAVVGGILRSVEDIVRGVTSSGLGERLGGCSSCEFPCAPPCCSRFDKGSISSSGGDLFNELRELIGNSNRSLLESS
jgi:hypothetical protein